MLGRVEETMRQRLLQAQAMKAQLLRLQDRRVARQEVVATEAAVAELVVSWAGRVVSTEAVLAAVAQLPVKLDVAVMVLGIRLQELLRLTPGPGCAGRRCYFWLEHRRPVPLPELPTLCRCLGRRG